MLAGIGLVIAAMTPRRGLGVAAVITVLPSSPACTAPPRRSPRTRAPTTARRRTSGSLSPFTLVDGVADAVLGAESILPASPSGAAAGAVFAAVTVALIARLPSRPAAALPEGLRLMSTIELDTASRWFGNVVAVNDVTMPIGPGVTGLLGPNGAGKSTLIHMMGGFLAPSSGSVTLDGEEVWRNERSTGTSVWSPSARRCTTS